MVYTNFIGGIMRQRERRLPYMEYQEAFDKFTELRKKVNDCVDNSPEKFDELWEDIKQQALYGSVVAMDILAYYYKTGITNLLPENYKRYLDWEFLSAGRGNKFAIDKLQFLIGSACEEISDNEEFGEMIYKNDITEENAVHVLGKAVCKILVRDFLKAYPVDLVQLEDDYQPYTQEAFVNLRKMIDDSVPGTIKFLLS